jgi:hypothetical protein
MSADHNDHSESTPAHAFDSPEEVAHAKEHAKENIFWFIGFFSLILLAVANYEFYGTENVGLFTVLTIARCLLIAFFLNWLFRSFSLVFRTLSFTILFFCGMVFLSWWDSTLPHIGDPIKIPGQSDRHYVP